MIPDPVGLKIMFLVLAVSAFFIFVVSPRWFTRHKKAVDIVEKADPKKVEAKV